MDTGELNAGGNPATDYYTMAIQGRRGVLKVSLHVTETGTISGLMGHLARMHATFFTNLPINQTIK